MMTEVNDERFFHCSSIISCCNDDDSGGDIVSATSNYTMSPCSSVSNELNKLILSTSPTTVSECLEDHECFFHEKGLIATRGSETTKSSSSDSAMTTSQWPIFGPSTKSGRTRNPIREIVDPMVAKMTSSSSKNEADKNTISLALGDPTAFGNLPPCSVAIQAVVDAVQAVGHCTSYVEACGLRAARKAIANNHRTNAIREVAEDDVIIANGCSGALEIAITAILDSNVDSVLFVPEPGFPLYQVIAESHGAQVCHYPLLAHRNWEIDLVCLRSSLIRLSKKNVVLVINNPSNPTGAVFSKRHLLDILRLCDEFFIPVISDEVYGNLTFPGYEFQPLARVAAESDVQVPIITASGLAKQFLLPGWRIGWIVFQDNKYGSLQKVKTGAKRLSQLILGASHLIQSVIPKLLQPDCAADIEMIKQFQNHLSQILYEQATFLCSAIDSIPSLQVMTKPAGAMYSMVRIHLDQFDPSDISNDTEFTQKLLEEESVFVLPGSCFNGKYCQNDKENDSVLGLSSSKPQYYFRVVFCAPIPILQEAANRIKSFCNRHTKK